MRFLWALFVRLRFMIWYGLLPTVAVYAQVFPVNPSHAQLNRLHSNTAQARLYPALGEAYLQTKLDSARHCFQQSINLAQEENSKEVLAKGYLKLSYTYTRQSNFTESIAADELTHLLNNPTVRVGTQGEPSTGLGLRLSQDLLARQGGSISISSQPDKGTTVRIRLPQSFSDPAVS